MDVKRLVIGVVVSYVVTSALGAIDKRLAWLYVALVFMIIIVTYKDEFFPAVGELTGALISA